MTTREIATAESGRDKLREKLGIHSEEYKVNDREVKILTIERYAEIWERKVTSAKAKKEI